MCSKNITYQLLLNLWNFANFVLFRKKNSRSKRRFAVSCFFWLRSCSSGHVTMRAIKKRNTGTLEENNEYSTNAAAIKSVMLFWQAMAESKHNTHIYIHFTTSKLSYVMRKTGILTTKWKELLKYTKHWKFGRNQPQCVVYPSSSPISSPLHQLSMYRTFLH